METVAIEIPSLPIPLSNWQIREIPLRIRRLRRVAHQPSRAYGAVLIWTNWDRAKAKIANTPLEELSGINDGEREFLKERRIQKRKKYACQT